MYLFIIIYSWSTLLTALTEFQLVFSIQFSLQLQKDVDELHVHESCKETQKSRVSLTFTHLKLYSIFRKWLCSYLALLCTTHVTSVKTQSNAMSRSHVTCCTNVAALVNSPAVAELVCLNSERIRFPTDHRHRSSSSVSARHRCV